MGKNHDQEFSILSTGVKFEGKLVSDGNLRLDGEFVGDIKLKGNLTLGDKSKSKGTISALNVTCGGEVIGNIDASEKLILEQTAKVEGDIFAKILVINEGAVFVGKSNLNKINGENQLINE
jgi:cytoskeletal protein CcmA (bactofilin family)